MKPNWSLDRMVSRPRSRVFCTLVSVRLAGIVRHNTTTVRTLRIPLPANRA